MKKYFLFVFSFLAAISCTDSIMTDVAEHDMSLEEARMKLSAMNFDTSNLYASGDYYVVEGDIIFHKDSLQRFHVTRQYHTTNRVDNEQTITIAVESVSMLQNWAAALASVASIYSQYTGLDVQFVGVDTSADIVVCYYTDEEYCFAHGEFPGTSGKPGKHIYINLTASINLRTDLTTDEKIYLLMHEAGHNLGLRHSNCMSIMEHHDNAHLIPNTPENDSVSYMKSWSGWKSWDGMPFYDKRALRYLFPPYYTIQFANTTMSDLHAFYSESGYYSLSRNVYPESDSLAFRGWFNDLTTYSAFNYGAITSDRILYARWETKDEDLTFVTPTYNGVHTERLSCPKRR